MPWRIEGTKLVPIPFEHVEAQLTNQGFVVLPGRNIPRLLVDILKKPEPQYTITEEPHE